MTTSTTSYPPGTTFTVRCQDDEVRHPHPFSEYTDAVRFAEWGHCCTAYHTIVVHWSDHALASAQSALRGDWHNTPRSDDVAPASWGIR